MQVRADLVCLIRAGFACAGQGEHSSTWTQVIGCDRARSSHLIANNRVQIGQKLLLGGVSNIIVVILYFSINFMFFMMKLQKCQLSGYPAG